jgi:AraC family transcriptional regulator
MTYPFKFAGAPEPTLTYSPARVWGGLTARLARASAGRHPAAVVAEHRLAFYASGPIATDCGADGLRRRGLTTPGDFDFVPGGGLGYWEDDAPVDIISIRLAPELIDETAEALGVPGGRVELAPKLGARDPVVSHVAYALRAELETPAHAGRLHADGLASALAARLVRDFTKRPVAMRQTLSKPKLRRLIDYVEANLEADLSLAELAAVAGLSIPHLTALFRRTMGQSLHRYVVERRVTRARSLLLEGRAAIAEVALSVGFAHQSHLSRWMRRMLGVTPAQVVRG